jgi:hypothetical protein
MLVPAGMVMADGEPEARNLRVTEYTEPYIGEGPIGQQLCPVGILSLDSITPGIWDNIKAGCYPIEISIFNDGQCGPALVKAFVDIYEKTEGEHVIMYETDFEDNFDIYNNWVQIDADSGLTGGYYDSWSWSDARAYCGDHSFKSTMYDVYKGNQDDYLQCTKSFDITDQEGINISFNFWVDGQGGDHVIPNGAGRYTPVDYLDFEFGDQFGNWFNPNVNLMSFVDHKWWFLLEGDYYFFDTSIQRYWYHPYKDYTHHTIDLGGGWWHTWFEISKQDVINLGLDPTDVMFRFSWHTDPEFQYEGAYVDCVKVVSIESYESKVFQSHSQGPFEIPEGISSYTFPLEWCVEGDDTKEDCYDIKLWLQVLDPMHESLSDWGMPGMLDIYVCVSDWYDCDVIDMEIETSFGGQLIIPGPGIMTQGEDAHITAWVHFDGTLPATDIPVTVNAYPKYWETVYTHDCETMAGWSTAGDAHATDKDAWSGSKSFGFFDAVNNEYDFDAFDYAYGPTIDFDVEELFMDFYYKCNTESGADDFFAPGFQAPYFNFVLGSGYAQSPTTPPPIGGFQPEWRGPLQPMSNYHSVDLLALYDWYSHYLRDPQGDPVYNLKVGGFLTTDDDLINTHPSAHTQDPPVMWSGVYIDDISIRAQKLGDSVFTQTVIIPGPVEPCDIVEVQFEWEDVPYSNYKIVVTCEDENACGNLEDDGESAQILVVSDLEKAHPKEVESIDLSDGGYGEWGPSSSDYDNYLASNYQYWDYPSYTDAVAQICPGTPGAETKIDVSNIGIGNPVIMCFDAWWDIEAGWDYAVIEVANYPAEHCTDWYQVEIDPCNFGYDEQYLMWYSTCENYYGYFNFFYPCLPVPDGDGWLNGMCVDLNEAFDFLGGLMGAFVRGDEIEVRFRLYSDSGWNQRGIKIDDLDIIGLDPDLNNGYLEDGPDTMDTMDNFCMSSLMYGQFWEEVAPAEWCAFWPDCGGIEDALVWTTEIMDAYEAYLTFETMFDFDGDAEGRVQISSDGGATWYTLALYTDGHTNDGMGWFTEHFDISAHAGNPILVRFIYENHGTFGIWCIKELQITGKKDTSAPTSHIQMTGTMKESGWYSTPVSITITAEDEGSGVKEIHYKLDGVETVVAGDTATFTVSGDGEHNIEFWAVDFTGNEGEHFTIPTFRIDSGSAPTVAITAPEPGLYLFGNKILSASKVIIIGAFTIEATASDAESGIYRVQFYLDGDIIAEDTEAPFSTYCAEKHMGAGTIKVVAEDFAQNTAEDTLDITYYKFL